MNSRTSPIVPDFLPQLLESQRVRVDRTLEELLPAESESPSSLHRAMRYSVFAGGKRIRPILCLEAGKLFIENDESLLEPACALELIHTYSLIHDDLPALDDDDLRRGKPSCHAAFNEATAILAGDALLTLAFEVLSGGKAASPERCLRASRELAHAIGTRRGMIGGQVADLEFEAKPVTPEALEYVHASKTGALLRASVRTGAILASAGTGSGAGEGDLERVSVYGEKIGLAFQVVDDLLDVVSSDEELGKTAGKDAEQKKATYPALYGVEKSKRIAAQLVEEASEALAPFAERARNLQAIAQYLCRRTS